MSTAISVRSCADLTPTEVSAYYSVRPPRVRQCGHGGSVYDLEMALTNEDFREAANQMRRNVGRPDVRVFEREHGWKHTAIYPYFKGDGRLSYVKVRFIDKQN